MDDENLKNLKKAIKIFKQTDEKYKTSSTFFEIAKYYIFRHKNYEKAEEYLDKAVHNLPTNENYLEKAVLLARIIISKSQQIDLMELKQIELKKAEKFLSDAEIFYESADPDSKIAYHVIYGEVCSMLNL